MPTCFFFDNFHALLSGGVTPIIGVLTFDITLCNICTEGVIDAIMISLGLYRSKSLIDDKMISCNCEGDLFPYGKWTLSAKYSRSSYGVSLCNSLIIDNDPTPESKTASGLFVMQYHDKLCRARYILFFQPKK